MKSSSIHRYALALKAFHLVCHQLDVDPRRPTLASLRRLGLARARQLAAANLPSLSPAVRALLPALRARHTHKSRGLSPASARAMVDAITGAEPRDLRDIALIALRAHMPARELVALRVEDCRWTRDSLELPGLTLMQQGAVLRVDPLCPVRTSWAWLPAAASTRVRCSAEFAAFVWSPMMSP